MCTMTRHDRDADKRELLRLFAKRFKGLKDASVQHMAGDVRLQGPVVSKLHLPFTDGLKCQDTPSTSTQTHRGKLSRRDPDSWHCN